MKRYFKFLAYIIVNVCVSFAHAYDPVDFFRAVAVDNAGAVRSALDSGFDPNTPSEKGQLPLYLALREGSPRVAEVLLASPATRIDAANAAGETALMMAALKGETDWVRRLLDRGAAIDRPGWTALHYAASGPEPRTLALLLERGAVIDAPSPNRSTPLMMAAGYGDERSVDLLIASGAKLALRNDLGLGAADFARRAGRERLAARLAALERPQPASAGTP